MKQTPAQIQAIEEWIIQINPPEIARDTIRKKFKRLNITPEEIQNDMNAKLARLND